MLGNTTATVKWRHQGSGVYTMWGDPLSIADLPSGALVDGCFWCNIMILQMDCIRGGLFRLRW